MNYPPTVQQPNEDDEPFEIQVILYINPRMLTKNRLVPLLGLAGHVELDLFFEEESKEPVIRIAIPSAWFDSASDEELLHVAALFRGMPNPVNYHDRLYELLQRSLN